MWLALKQAATRRGPRGRDPDGGRNLPDLGLLQKQLGDQGDAILYRKLLVTHPGVERGPDEEIDHHFSRLKAAEKDRVGSEPMRPKTQPDPFTREVKTPTPEWLLQRQREEEAASAPPDLKGMPQRIPGWFTGDAMDAPPPGYGTPPMSRRDPGATMRAPVSPDVRPRQQTRDEWVKWLADKGIAVGLDGRRMTPQELELPRRPLTGPQIWQPFVDTEAGPVQPPEKPSWVQRAKNMLGRHASAEAVEHLASMMAEAASHELEPNPDYMIPGTPYHDFFTRYNKMRKRGWDLVESGSGNHWHKQIGDKHHFLTSDSDGWTHHTGDSEHSYAGSYGDGPYKEIDEALLNIQYPTRGLSAKPSQTQDSTYPPNGSWGETVPLEMLPGDHIKGRGNKFQTLNSTKSA